MGGCSVPFQGIDVEYDERLHQYFMPYHQLVDYLIRTAANMQSPLLDAAVLVGLYGVVGKEQAILQLPYFAKFCLDSAERADKVPFLPLRRLRRERDIIATIVGQLSFASPISMLSRSK